MDKRLCLLERPTLISVLQTEISWGPGWMRVELSGVPGPVRCWSDLPLGQATDHYPDSTAFALATVEPLDSPTFR